MRKVIALLLVTTLLSACSIERLDSGDSVAADGFELPTTTTTAASDRGGTASTTTTVAGGATPSSTPGGAPGPSAAPGRAPTANITQSSEPRRASDRGVTENEIVLGILATDEGFFAAAGGGETKRHEQIYTPFLEEINAQGGINGRKVVAKITRYDPLSADSMQAACVQQAEDHKVFSSIAQAGYYGDAEVCMATKQVPLLTGNGSSAHTNYEREKGWVRQTQQNKDRNIKSWIDWMVGVGMLTPETKTGVIDVDVPEDKQLVEQVVLPYLKSLGLQTPVRATLSASIAQTPTEAQSAVLRFRGEGVRLVLPFVSFLRMLIFANQADGAQYKPQYSVSDFGLLSTDAMAGMPPSQWEGVTGITAFRTGVDPIGQKPSTPQFKECEAVYNQGGQQLKPDDGVELAQMMHYCQHLALWADAARRAGVNPTRQSFLGALGSTGTWSHRVVLTERLTFAPDKYDGADLIAVVRWQSGCNEDGGCYRQIEGFRESTW